MSGGAAEAGGPVQVHVGDCRAVMAGMDAASVDAVVTSPPYWGLRDYGVAGQLGMEPTLTEHIDTMVDVFAHAWRVLRPGGTLWLNYGDCYATAPNGTAAAMVQGDDRTFRDKPFGTVAPDLGIKPRDLCMIPARLALALQAWGWGLRAEIIWGKPNAMPDSSGVYRPAVAHEKIYMLTKESKGVWLLARDTGDVRRASDLTETERAAKVQAITALPGQDKPVPRWRELAHYYDASAVRRPAKVPDGGHGTVNGWATGDTPHSNIAANTTAARQAKADKQRGHSRRHDGFNDRWDHMSKIEQQAKGRLLRNYEPCPVPVWHMATAAFSEAHFATFPPELAERCILAGCPAGGAVLDPFGGAGTTGLVATALGRRAVLIELNPDYAALTRRRLQGGLTRRAAAAPDSGIDDLFAGVSA